ncbi:MAG: hypothetical protein ABFD97_10320 [Syntrophobacter sp.]
MPPRPAGVEGVSRLSTGEECPYCQKMVPLADVPNALAHGRDLLLHAWETLGSAETLNSEVAACVLRVLVETVADPEIELPNGPILVPEEPPPSPHPTAAHPRAYSGTKYKPPKHQRASLVDPHSCLCSDSDTATLLAGLDPFFEGAAGQIRSSLLLRELPSSGEQDPIQFLERWRSSEYRKRIASLPAHFRRNMLWSVRKCDWETIAAALSAYWALGLEYDDALRRCVSAFLSIRPQRQTVDWCHVISRMPPARRMDFTELLIESGACTVMPDQQTISDLVRSDALSSDAAYRHRIFYALTSLKQECGLNYANDGFLLSNEYYENYEFEEVGSLHGVAAAVRPFAEYVAGFEDWPRGSAMTLWKRCSELEGFKGLLEHLDWRSLDPRSAFTFFRILGDIVYEELGEKKRKTKWHAIRQSAHQMLGAVARVPVSYCPKFLEGLSEVLWAWDDPKKLGSVLKPFIDLLIRLSSSQFKERVFSTCPLTAFTALPEEEWSRIRQAGDASFARLEQATARKNDSFLIGQGLWSLCDIYPRLVSSGFSRYPQKLFKTAHTLGALDVPYRREIIKAFTGHPLASIDIAGYSAEALVALAEKHLGSGVENPIPRRLKEHVCGKRLLNKAQVARDMSLVHGGWLAFQLDVLNQIAFDQISIKMPPVHRTSKIRHAFMIQQMVLEHRRCLRRLLKAYLSGHRDYSEQHPRNREWLSRHPRIDPEKWLHGIAHRSEVNGQGVITLSVERDALEVLRLGSYFGTCLGIGGGLSYSAAAITLDVNKQVVYARDAAGRVIARQLLAIAEDDSLICFSVYPVKSPKEIRCLFKEYDLLLAAFLGVAIFKRQADDDHWYEIASTISKSFWDDDAWDLDIADQ